MRVGIVEPYLGGSHRAWAMGYQSRSRHDVSLVALEARFWKWRMQGGHVTLADRLVAEVAAAGPFDILVGTSMLNVAGFLGLARKTIGSIPLVLFMHENQLSYPLSPQDRSDQSYPMINWTSMLASDRVVFNSEFHRDEWFAALPKFLGQFPDYPHQPLVPSVRERTIVLPVGVDLARLDEVERVVAPVPRILWNQRWEYDKGPTEFARALSMLDERGVEFELILAGERFVSDPEAFVRLRRRLGDRVIHYGWAEGRRYTELLRSSDIVVSTAHQEFFGISITEAIYAGAFPVLPSRLVYPERLPPAIHERCLYHDDAELVDLLTWAIRNRESAADIAAGLREEVAAVDWAVVAPRYDAALEELV
jgi:glycosyltransferase involved in cell wall biosynthesis